MEELSELGHLDGDIARKQLGHRGDRRRAALVGVHLTRCGICDSPGRDQPRRHPPEVVPGESVIADRPAELLALRDVPRRRLERGRGHATGPTTGLEPAGREPRHLEREAAAERCLAADQVCIRHEPAVEREPERVHAAVPRRAIGLAFERAAGRLRGRELVAVEARLLDDEQGQPLRAVARAREQRDHVGAPGERAPRLRAGDGIAAFDLLRSTRDRGHIGAGVRLRHRDRRHDLPRGELRQPQLLLRFGPAGDQRLREDLGPRDQRARRRERRARQLLGREDHREIAELVAAVGLGDREAEVAELRHLGDEPLGDELVVMMDALRVRQDLPLGERAHVRAHLVQRLVEWPREPARVRDRELAERSDRLRARRLHDRIARCIAVARLADPERRRDRFEAVAQRLCEVARGHGGGARELLRQLLELRDHARFGRGVGDALDDDLVLIDRLAVAGQDARGLDGATSKTASGGRDCC